MTFSLADLFKDSAYRLDQFQPAHIAALQAAVTVKTTGKAATPYVTCLLRGKPIKLDVYGTGWQRLRKLRAAKDENRDFQFDVLMANPPFAGDIKETHILSKYELARSVSFEKVANVAEGDKNIVDARARAPSFPEAFTEFAKKEAFSFFREQTLLKKLGLDTWNPPEALSYVRASSEAFAAGRFDAEHFQPKFLSLIQLLEATGQSVRLGDYLRVNQRGKQPDYADEGLPVINSKHVLRNDVRLDEDNRCAVAAANGLQIETGDVLINGTGVGTIGRAAAYLHEQTALPDNHVTILRPVEGLDAVYLSVFLNSTAGQLQVEQRLRGSSGQIELYPADIAEFRIWLAPLEVQQRIRAQVEKSFAQRQRATRLLDAARRAVEIAIEDSEAAAQAFLEGAV